MLFVGDDWAEDHHDVEIVDEAGRRLARRRLPEGVTGISQLHALIAAYLPEGRAGRAAGEAAAQVKVGIETERGPWVQALVAAGYEVFPVNPMPVARYRERHSTSGAKPDAADAHLLAEIIRLDRAHHRPLAADSPLAEAVKLTARAHQSLIWDRSRHVLRLRAALREFFPAALAAFPDLDAPDALDLLTAAPDPARAAALSLAKITTVVTRACWTTAYAAYLSGAMLVGNARICRKWSDRAHRVFSDVRRSLLALTRTRGLRSNRDKLAAGMLLGTYRPLR